MHSELVRILLTLLGLYVTLGIAHSSVIGEAKVQVMSQRIKRSTATDKVKHVYDVKVSAFGVTHDLKLQPANSVIGPNFRYNEVSTDNNGRTVWTDVTPSREEIEALEEKIYVDVEKNTAVTFENVAGEFEMNGIVNDAKIRKRRQTMTTIEFPGNIDMETRAGPSGRTNDYMIIEPRLTPRSRADMTIKTPLLLQPELHFVIDYAITKNFTDPKDLLEYMAIMVNSVNNKYALTNTPSLTIVFRFVGLTAIMSESTQPFVTKAYVGDGLYHLHSIYNRFIYWSYKNRDMLGKFDISPLQLGLEFNQTGLQGTAALSGGCNVHDDDEENYAISCSQDIGNFFGGAFTLTHELAHSLGSPHDSEPATEACPFTAGFIMSYVGWGTTDHFKLSPCSLAQIRKYAITEQGRCLSETSGRPTKHSSSVNAGDIVNSMHICTTMANGAVPYGGVSPDAVCRQTLCAKPGVEGLLVLATAPPGNGAPCGAGGKCKNGWCIGQGAARSLEDICDKSHLDYPNAEYVQPEIGVDICGAEFIKCNVPSLNSSFMLGYTPIPGTPCDVGWVCLRNTCTRKGKHLTTQDYCLILTGKNEARVGSTQKSSTNECMPSTKCIYGTESERVEVPLNLVKCTPTAGGAGGCTDGACKATADLSECEQKFFAGTKDGASCTPSDTKFGNSAECVKGECFPSYRKRFLADSNANKTVVMSLSTACEKLADKEGTLATAGLCVDLVCTKPDGVIVHAEGNTPDGTKCGPRMRCKAGKCERCG